MRTYPPARKGNCAKCMQEGCQSCGKFTNCGGCMSGYASIPAKYCKEDEFCEEYTCVKCEDPNCGNCYDDPKKCRYKAATCKEGQKTIRPATKATKVRWIGNVCLNRMGRDGDGYTRYFHAWVKDNKCMDCTSFTPYRLPKDKTDEEIVCEAYSRALSVAANAWVNVPCRSKVMYKLIDWCFGPTSNYPFGARNATIVTESSCRTTKGKKIEKVISTVGGWVIDTPYVPARIKNTKDWTWSEAPMPDAAGRCKFKGRYNLTPAVCPSFQLVAESSCKVSTATVTNGEYYSGSFGPRFLPLWEISGNSDQATLTSIRNCDKSILSTKLRSSRKLTLVSKGSKKSIFFSIAPIRRNGPCTDVHIMRNVSSNGRTKTEFLSAASDCVQLKWDSRSSERSTFKIEKRCSKDSKRL